MLAHDYLTNCQLPVSCLFIIHAPLTAHQHLHTDMILIANRATSDDIHLIPLFLCDIAAYQSVCNNLLNTSAVLNSAIVNFVELSSLHTTTGTGC